VPKIFTSGAKAEGRNDKSDFIYDAKRDAYRCPAGEWAVRRFLSVEKHEHLQVLGLGMPA
jgi:hypothetical protein